MERKISGASGKHLILALSLALCASPHVHAGGGGLSGGALEITQLANNAELVASVSEAVQTTANTLMTARTTMQMLRNLPETLLSEVLGGLPIETVRAMADAYTVMSSAVSVYREAEDVLRQAKDTAERLNISPSELLRLKAEAAYRYGGVYKQTYENEQARLRRLAEVSKEVQKQAETIRKIDSQVSGIQMLASQNIQMQSMLAEIAHSIATANKNAAYAAEQEENTQGDRNKREAAALEELKRNREASLEVARTMSTDGLIKIGK